VARSIGAWAVLLLGLCVPAVARANSSGVSRYVLPPGNYGGIPTGPHSLDQLSLYSGLTRYDGMSRCRMSVASFCR